MHIIEWRNAETTKYYQGSLQGMAWSESTAHIFPDFASAWSQFQVLAAISLYKDGVALVQLSTYRVYRATEVNRINKKLRRERRKAQA